MQYSSQLLVKTYILIFTATSGSCWQYFTSLGEITLFNSPKDPKYSHSEYLFGKCRSKTHVLYTHIHLDHTDVLGKVIVRGWINVMRIPTCTMLKARSHESDMFRSTSYSFQLCVPRIGYCHSQERYLYYYYELYIPEDYVGGMDFDIYFYGPPTPRWW